MIIRRKTITAILWIHFFSSTIRSTQSIVKDQLFSTKPRLARSGSKSKLDRSHLPPTDPSSSSRQAANENNSNGRTTQRTTNTNVEIIGKGYIDEQSSLKQFSTEAFDDKQPTDYKTRTKINKGKRERYFNDLNVFLQKNRTLLKASKKLLRKESDEILKCKIKIYDGKVLCEKKSIKFVCIWYYKTMTITFQEEIFVFLLKSIM